jgi:hypothetical protein
MHRYEELIREWLQQLKLEERNMGKSRPRPECLLPQWGKRHLKVLPTNEPTVSVVSYIAVIITTAAATVTSTSALTRGLFA